MARPRSRTDSRVKKLEEDSRESRAMSDRHIAEDREQSDELRLQEYRKSFYQSALPDLPKIAGYHVCWLTTTNPRDSIASRLRLGYEPIKPEDIPGWENASIKSGEHAGLIGVNEMLAFKIPIELYEMYMKETHHTQPLYEEQKLKIAREIAEEEAMSTSKSGEKISFELEEGNAELANFVPDPPAFEEVLGH